MPSVIFCFANYLYVQDILCTFQAFFCTKSFTVLYDDTLYYSYVGHRMKRDTLDPECWCSIHMYCPASQERQWRPVLFTKLSETYYR